MLGRQVKIAHGIDRPLRFAGIEVEDERVACLGAHGDCLEHAVVARKMVGDGVLLRAVAFWLLHAMHEFIAIHLAVGIHRHLTTRVAGKRVNA